jgi:uncharacterized protein (UPF0333 family)
MVSLLKLIIIVASVMALIYAAGLAMQGDLEMEVIMQDYAIAKAYLINHLPPLLQ